MHYYAMQLIEGTTLAQMISELRQQKDGRADSHPAIASEKSTILSPVSSGSAIFFREAAHLGLQAALLSTMHTKTACCIAM